MEIKAQLNKPYTEEQRLNFIVLNNHQLGYVIKETPEAILAWGYTDEEIQEQQKQAKIQEINRKITELEQESVKEILYGNDENVKVYQNVINGLIATKNSLKGV